MQQFLKYFFILSALLILVVYFKGTASLGDTVGHVVQTISYAATGRNASGNFAAYPSGG